MTTALLFSGQGSQYVGMTKDLCERYAEAEALAARANSLLEFDLSSLMMGGPVETLTETRYTQPALFLHEAMVQPSRG